LALENLKIPKNGVPGGIAEYTFNLINQDLRTAVGDYVIGAWISDDKSADAADRYVGYVNTGNTPVGVIPDVLGAVSIPAEILPGDYYLVLKADKDALIRESDEKNNETSAPFRIDRAPERQTVSGCSQTPPAVPSP
jgi:CARDB